MDSKICLHAVEKSHLLPLHGIEPLSISGHEGQTIERVWKTLERRRRIHCNPACSYCNLNVTSRIPTKLRWTVRLTGAAISVEYPLQKSSPL